ncbi:hypothetical protein Tco_0792106 [Tanacetum coccineum]
MWCNRELLHEYGRQGHFKKDCPKLKNQSHRKQAANGKACGRAYALGGGEPNQDSNIVTGTFLLNNHYAFMLFHFGINRSFVLTTFSSLIDISPITLDYSYAVELADGRVIESSTILRGCTVNLLDHPFNIDMMPVELGSFNVLTIHGDGSDERSKSNLSIISCTKNQKYNQKGCYVFLAQIIEKKSKDKSKEKRLEDVPIIQDFPEVFPKDLPRLPPTQEVERNRLDGEANKTLLKGELPEQLSRVHNTFHVLNLKKCLSDDTLAIPLDEDQIDDKLHFIEEPVEIIDREVKHLKQSRIFIIKVRWNSRRGPEFTWEHEDQFRKKYPHMFSDPLSAPDAMA